MDPVAVAKAPWLSDSQSVRYQWSDSGAIYRLHAYEALQRSIPLDQSPVGFGQATWNTARGDEIRTELIGKAASQISAFPSVRQALLERQRQYAQEPGLVTDGRDMGSVVFPHAQGSFI